MESYLATQAQIMDAMHHLFVNFKKDGSERKSPDYIRRKQDILDTYWSEFQLNHEQLMQWEDKSHPYFQENKFEACSKLKLHIQEYMSRYGRPENPKESRPTTPLLKQPVLTFEGSYAGPVPKPGSSSQGNPSKTDELLRKQSSNFKAFHRLISTIDLDEINEKWEFEDTLRTLQSKWTAIDLLHWEIDSELCADNVEYETTFIKYEQKYKSIKKAINSKMWSVSHVEKSTPQMEIPTFNGNYQTWTSFKDLFTETIHNNPSLSRAQKMQFLKSKVKGEAEKLIQHLSIGSENYQVCWGILNNRYNNKKMIFSSYMNTLLNLPTVQYQTSNNIKRIHDTTNECLHAINNLGVDTSTWDPILVHLLSQKLDSDTYNDYIESLKTPRELPNLTEFMMFLEGKFTSLESSRRKPETAKSLNYQQQSETSFGNRKLFQHTYKSFSTKPNNMLKLMHSNCNSSFKTNKVGMIKCPLCKNEHGLFHCNVFLGLQPDEKRTTISKHNLCKNCLYDHKGKPCTSEKRCRVCNENHNTLLHEAFAKKLAILPPPPPPGGHSKQPPSNNSSNVSQGDASEVLLATAQVNVQAADGSMMTLRALIDQGSQVSLISENAAQNLGLPRQRCSGVIFGVGAKENNCKGTMSITCTSINNNYTFTTDVFIMRNLINSLPNRSFPKPASWKHLENINLADPEFSTSRPVDILFGADIYSNIILSGIIRGDETQPIAQQSRLGWILCGKMKSYQCNVILNNLEDINRFWAIEDISENSLKMSSEDYHCLQQYKQQTTRREDGRYIVRLPLKPEIKEKLGESKQKAIAQFHNLENKFKRSEKIATDYKAFINEYIELNHMHLCNSNETPSYYLPHHCVTRADSTTTALRVVFNASSPTTSGYSLNDMMYCGPNLQADLFSLILRWRQYKIAFTADIEKMFRQILCHEDDQIYQKIIWRNSADQSIREYALSTVTYGTKAAPFLAMMTLKQLASDESHRYPEAAAILEREFYTDDLLSGSHSIQAAKSIKSDLIMLLQSGGFNLRKWSSNFLELSDGDNKASNTQESFEFRHQESRKTLGLRWSPSEDNFNFQLNINISSSKPATKRSLLSDISKIYDPLGWLCPVTTKLKLMFQNIWQQELRWDDPVPDAINKEWLKIKPQLTEINHIKIPRWLQSVANDNIELHGYCDASEKAYACVIYSKIKTHHHHHSIVIVAAKSRLVPAKKCITLPRLELCAAFLLSKLMQNVQDCLSSHSINVYAWSDSTAVLGWLHGDPSRWKPFVSNRVSKIIEIIPSTRWRYVKTGENPADCASRGITPTQLKEHSLWWQGPTWLPTFQAEKENNQIIYETQEEIKIKSLHTNNVIAPRHTSDVISGLITKHSSLSRVTRVLAWVLRALSRDKHRPSFLTASETKKARNKIIKHVQHTSFEDEITYLHQVGRVQPKSKLLPFNPILDQDGLLRVGGRISNAHIHEDQKHPLIIPHAGRLTELLIDHAHISTFHGGARLTQAKLRQQYWVIGGNRAVKKRIYTCIKCRRHNPIQQTQIMGDLPAPRCNPTRPFYHTGVDYTGYLDIKSNKGRGIKTTKGYVAVFVCMVTKAVHLELVSDISSSAFLAALRRLSARRGAPRHMYSDNGTNFVGASKLLTNEFIDLKKTLDDEFYAAVSEMQIEWHFSAPSWPSAGGLWEAAVKSLKFHLRRVIGDQKLTYEEMSTLLSQIEACLNARPLCALTEDPQDIDYLTPSHFLSSGPTLTILETETDERTRWQFVQKIFKDIWKRWVSEYLSQLSSRAKWQQKQENMKINDIVAIHDVKLPALGRVIDLHPGKDGFVRVVTVKTKTGVLKRPITKLSRLPINPAINQDNEQPDQTQKTKQKINTSRKSSSCNLIWLFMSILSFLTPARCAHSLTQLNNNQSMYFDKISNMQLARDEWKLIVYYDLDPYWQGLQLFESYIKNLDDLCSRSENSHCDVVLLQLRHGLAELDYYNSLLLGQQVTRSRHRRGLINGVGYLANSLFGVLDERFAEQYKRDIDLIKQNQRHIVLLWKNQTSVVEAEYNVLKRVEQAMDKQHKIFNQHIISLEKASNKLAKDMMTMRNTNDFILFSIITNSILENLKDIQEALLETATKNQKGNLNTHLLTPEQLKNELNIISGQLPKDLAIPIDNIQSDLYKIYHLLKIEVRMTAQYFIFEIRIPLVSRDNYEIYKLIAVPQNTHGTMIRIIPIAEYLAINIEKDSYIDMSENEIQRCTPYNSLTLMCPLQRPLYQMKSENTLCVKNEENDQCQTISNKCTESWTELHKLNTYLYFYCTTKSITILCEHQVTVEQVSKAGIITLGESCVIKGGTFTIYSHKQQSNDLKILPHLLDIEIPPINKLFKLSIPTDQLESSNETVLSDYQKELSSIGEQVKQLKNTNINEVEAEITYHDVHQYVMIYLLASAALLAVILYLWRRRRVCCSATLPAVVSGHTPNEPSIHYTNATDKAAPHVTIYATNSSEKMTHPSSSVQDKATSPIFTPRYIKS